MTLLQDIRYGIRMLRKNPAFTAVVVGVLALGIGANTTVFTLVNAVLFRALPFHNGERVMFLTSSNLSKGRQNVAVSYPDFRDWKADAKSFSGLAAWGTTGVSISDRTSTPERYNGARITSNAFSLIGQAPTLGRDFTPADEQKGAPATAIIGHGIWKNRYGGKDDVIGRTIRINDVPTTVIGVMPADFKFPVNEEVWMAATPQADWEKRDNRFLFVFGRLVDGVNVASARAELDLIGARLEKAYPKTNTGIAVSLKTFNEQFNGGNIRSIFLAMLGAVAFVLLIACANVANLLLARSVSRTKEVSIRVALGAGRLQIIRQLLVESVLLGILGGAAGLGLATAGVRAFDLAVASVGKPYWIKFTMDFSVFAYVGGICILTGLVFGIAPAFHTTRVNVNEKLKDGGRSTTGSVQARYLSSAFVIAEVALAMVLMAGAGLLVRSLVQLYTLQVGSANPNNVLTLRLNLLKEKYPDAPARWRFYETLLNRLSTVPGVDSVALISHMPVSGSFQWEFQPEGQPLAEKGKRPVTDGVIITADYFRSAGVTLLTGRTFDQQDGLAGRTVAIVNRRFAAKYWGQQNPVGKRIRLIKDGEPEQPWLTVVGLAPDIRQNDPTAGEVNPVLYVPLRQDTPGFISIMARTTVAAGTLAAPFRQQVQSIDADMPAFGVMTLEDLFANQRWPFRVFGTVFVIFSLFALTLAAVGIYSVIAYSVSQRTPEIGVRVALGASSGSVVRLVLSQGVLQLAIGLAIGLAGAFGVTRAIKGVMVQISPTDPLTFGATALILIIAATLACLIPARRAAKIDPIVALRYE